MRVSNIHLRALFSACEARGLSATAVIEEARVLTRLSTDDDYGFIDLCDLDALTCAAVRLTGDPAFGLRWSESSSVMQFDLPSLLLGAAPSLRVAFEAILEAQPLLGDRRELSLEVQADDAILCVQPAAVTEVCARVRCDVIMSGFERLLRKMGASGERAPRVWFAYPSPADPSEYEAFFQGRVAFDRPYTGIHFSRSLLEQPYDVPNAQLFQTLRSELHKLTQRSLAARSLQARVTAELEASLPVVPSTFEMARRVGLSERSLRRRLTEEHTSYSRLVEDAQLELARALLEDPAYTLKQVASAVGFADVSAFRRAFRRWTTVSLTDYRAGARS